MGKGWKLYRAVLSGPDISVETVHFNAPGNDHAWAASELIFPGLQWVNLTGWNGDRQRWEAIGVEERAALEWEDVRYEVRT